MNLDSLSANYVYDDTKRSIVASSNTLLLSGISGAGKDTIKSLLLANGSYRRIVTHTTRSPRSNNGVMEEDGREYHFVSIEQMAQLLRDQQLIEINKYGSNYYGTSVSEFANVNTDGAIALGDIDVNGIEAFRSIGNDAVRAIFIVPPDYQTWLRRLSARYDTDDEFVRELSGRSATAVKELERALAAPFYHFIINDNLDRAVRVIDEIAHRKDGFNDHDIVARYKAHDLLAAIKNTPL